MTIQTAPAWRATNLLDVPQRVRAVQISAEANPLVLPYQDMRLHLTVGGVTTTATFRPTSFGFSVSGLDVLVPAGASVTGVFEWDDQFYRVVLDTAFYAAADLSSPGAPTWRVCDADTDGQFTLSQGFDLDAEYEDPREVLNPELLPGFADAADEMEAVRREGWLTWRHTPGLLTRSLDELGAVTASVTLPPDSAQWGQNFDDTATVGAYSMDAGEAHGGMMLAQRFVVTRPVEATTLRLEFVLTWEGTDPDLARAVNGLQVVLVGAQSGVLADTARRTQTVTSVGIEGATDRGAYRVYMDVLLGGFSLAPGEVYTLLLSARQSQAWLDLPYVAPGAFRARNVVPGELLARLSEVEADRSALTHPSDSALDGTLLFELGEDLPRAATQIITGTWAYGAEGNAPAYSHAAGRMIFPAAGPGSETLDSASGPETEATYSYLHHPAIPSVMGDVRRPFVSDVAPGPLTFQPNGGSFTGAAPTMQAVAIHLSHPGGTTLNGLRLSGPALAAVQARLASGDFALRMEMYDTTIAARDGLDALWNPESGSVPLYDLGTQEATIKRASAFVQDPTITTGLAPWTRRDRTYLIVLYAVPIYWYGAPYGRESALPIWPTSGAGVSRTNPALEPQVQSTWANLSGRAYPDYLHFERGLPEGIEVLAGGGKKDALGGGAPLATGGQPGAATDGLLHFGMLGGGVVSRLSLRAAHGPDQDALVAVEVAGAVVGTLTVPAGSTALHTLPLGAPAAAGDVLRVAISGASGASDLVWMVE